MTPAEQELPALIRLHLPSVWSLEILLLLRGQPERIWTCAEIVGELRATSALVENSLTRLERSGLLVGDEPGRFRYQPASTVLAEFCDLLAIAYRERPVAIINLISAPEDILQKLADAFRFRTPR